MSGCIGGCGSSGGHGIGPRLGIKYLFDPCPNSNCSICFDVKPGYHGVINVYDLPEGVCFSAFKYVYGCCNTPARIYPAKNACGCDICTNEPGVLYLPPGRYHICLTTCENGVTTPYIPDPGEIVASIENEPGQIPMNQCQCANQSHHGGPKAQLRMAS